jgi:catechol-2,3-dioxygenase
MLVLLYGLVMVMKAKFTYVGIRVRDLKRSIEFHTKLLGMKVAGRGRLSRHGVRRWVW